MDLAPLVRLKESLETAHNNTSSMLWKLRDFESRLASLDKKMLPIQNSTSKLSTAKTNIGLTFIEIEKTNEYFRLASENSSIITKGLRGNSENFFEAVERITIAKRYFDSHRDMKSSAAALTSIDGMIKRAMAHCIEEADRAYRTCGRCYRIKDGEYVALNPMSEEIAASVKAICDCLETHNVSTHLNMYLTQRTAIIKSELKNFEEQSTGGGMGQSSTTGGNIIPLLEFITDGSVLYTKGNFFFPKYYSVAFTMLRGELMLWSTSLSGHSPESSAVFTSICEVVISELERVTAPYLLPTTGLQGTGSSKKKSGPVVMQQKNNMFLIRMDLLDVFLSRFLEFRDLCTPDDDNISPQKTITNSAVAALYSFRDNMARSAVAALDEVLKAIRLTQATAQSSGSSASPPMHESCDLHPISGYVLCFCKEVVAFENVYQDLLEIAAEISCPISHLPPSTVGLESFVLDGLIMRLQERNKGTFESSPSAGSVKSTGAISTDVAADLRTAKRHIFMLNNMDVVAIHLRGRISALHPQTGGRKEGRVSVLKNFSIVGGKAGITSNTGGGDPYSPSAMLTSLYHNIEGRIQSELNELCSLISSLLLNCTSLDAAEEAAALRSSSAFSFSNSMKSNTDLVLAKKLKVCFGTFNDIMDTLIGMHDQW
eukprot:CAMPEP_0185033494 /NCGR_PEP_ID=MMETSP1103-20130426/22481_1 /TAXON_ID=36769 /ORGANISM="Paraphysomonas bandaiensis, Strain Caron Lab Isolate" /LENGTH=656 /DNA_ID=CAMNT_0027569775 /DNA_START=21 /DNA_END=1988 /DNA_ORIENTATION=-